MPINLKNVRTAAIVSNKCDGHHPMSQMRPKARMISEWYEFMNCVSELMQLARNSTVECTRVVSSYEFAAGLSPLAGISTIDKVCVAQFRNSPKRPR